MWLPLLVGASARTLALARPSSFAMARARGTVACASSRYPIKEVTSLQEVKWPEQFPFADERYFARQDESSDDIFYESPRFVTHIDGEAIGALTHYYGKAMREGHDVLDLCSSWVSHLPPKLQLRRVAGLGMNEAELKENPQLTEFQVQNLNADPTLPYEDESFDFVCNVVSVDYLNQPIPIFKEMHRCMLSRALLYAQAHSTLCMVTSCHCVLQGPSPRRVGHHVVQ
jgi:hypothetical protein